MSETPTWLHGLIYDTAAWGVDGIAVLFPTAFEVAWRWIPIALTSGAEHELDYYTRQQGNWWFNPDGTVTFTGTIYTFPNGEEMQGIVVVHAADGGSATIPATSESRPE